VVVIGGHATMVGAPCFVALGALRAGCGSVRLAVSDEIMTACLTMVPSAIGLPRPADAMPAMDGLAGAVIAAGPGLGLAEGQRRLIGQVLRSPHPLVLDGDGLTHLAHSGTHPATRSAPLVLTPHLGEYGRLAAAWSLPELAITASDEERRAAARQLAASSGAVVVIKGHRSVVATAQESWICRSGSAALAIPGSGDVLSGVISALMAQGMPAYDATRLGTHLHGMAGDRWAETRPFGLLAADLAELIPEVAHSYALLQRIASVPGAERH